MKTLAKEVANIMSAGKLDPDEILYTRETIGFVARKAREEALSVVKKALTRALSIPEPQAEAFCRTVSAAIIAEYRSRRP